MLFYNGNRLSEMWSPYGLKTPRHGERAALLHPRHSLRRAGTEGPRPRRRRGDQARRPEGVSRAAEGARGDHHGRRRGLRAHRPRLALVHGDRDLLRRRAGHRPRMRALVRRQAGLRRRRRQFRRRGGAAGRPRRLPSLPPAPDHEARHPPPRRHDLRGAGRARGVGSSSTSSCRCRSSAPPARPAIRSRCCRSGCDSRVCRRAWFCAVRMPKYASNAWELAAANWVFRASQSERRSIRRRSDRFFPQFSRPDDRT